MNNNKYSKTVSISSLFPQLLVKTLQCKSVFSNPFHFLLTDQSSLLQDTVRSLFDYCSRCDLPVKDVAAGISKKLGRTYLYTRASIKEAVETIFPGVIHTSKISIGPQHSKWRLCTIILPWNYDAVEIPTNLNVAQSVKKRIISLTLFPFPSTLDKFQMVKQCLYVYVYFLFTPFDR